MSRRDKLRKGNPSPKKSRNWLENRFEENETPAIVFPVVKHDNGQGFILYPVNRRIKRASRGIR